MQEANWLSKRQCVVLYTSLKSPQNKQARCWHKSSNRVATHPPRKVQNSQQTLAFRDQISTAAILGYCYEKIKSQENEIMTPIFYSTAERDWSGGVKSRPNKATVRINKRILISNNTLLSFLVFVALCCCIFLLFITKEFLKTSHWWGNLSCTCMLNTVTKCQ